LSKKITKATAKKIARMTLDKKAEGVVLLDLRKITTMSDFFVVCSGTSGTQVRAIADHVITSCKKNGIEISHVEGYESMRWVLIDLIEVVVHVFQPEVRTYYQLERLWGDAAKETFSYEGGEAAV
jgi:ribosome-associated protein